MCIIKLFQQLKLKQSTINTVVPAMKPENKPGVLCFIKIIRYKNENRTISVMLCGCVSFTIVHPWLCISQAIGEHAMTACNAEYFTGWVILSLAVKAGTNK